MWKDENEKLEQATVPEEYAAVAVVFGDYWFFADELNLSL